MAVENLNIINCAAGDVIGTGLAGCRTDMKRIVAAILIERGYKFTEDVNEALLLELQQTGKVIWLGGVVTFALTAPDNTYDTAPGSGIKTLLTEFPYEAMIEFNNGINFQKALTALSGNGNYDLAVMDVDDQIWLTQSKSGDVKGYSMGVHQKGPYVGMNGETRAKQSLFVQLLDRNEIDARAAWVEADFSASERDGVNDVTITIDPISVAASATTIVFTPKLLDGTHLVEGLVLADIRVKNEGVVVTPTGTADYAANPGKVTLTVAAMSASEVITVELWDSVLGVPIILSGTEVLYKSNVATATVTA